MRRTSACVLHSSSFASLWKSSVYQVGLWTHCRKIEFATCRAQEHLDYSVAGTSSTPTGIVRVLCVLAWCVFTTVIGVSVIEKNITYDNLLQGERIIVTPRSSDKLKVFQSSYSFLQCSSRGGHSTLRLNQGAPVAFLRNRKEYRRTYFGINEIMHEYLRHIFTYEPDDQAIVPDFIERLCDIQKYGTHVWYGKCTVLHSTVQWVNA